jgi:hypothetical protein
MLNNVRREVMTDIKKGAVVFVPDDDRVQKLTVTRTSKGFPYVKFPGSKTATKLTPDQVFLNELKALRQVERNLGGYIKEYRYAVTESRKNLRLREKGLAKYAKIRDQVRTQIKSINGRSGNTAVTVIPED